MSLITDALNQIAKAFFCNRCAFCGAVIELDEMLCSDCKSLPVIDKPVCLMCGSSEQDCTCKKHKNEYKNIVSVYYYEESLIRAIHNFKEHDMPFLSARLGADIAGVVEANYADVPFDMITYVPLRLFHQRVREFNQSQLLAEEVSKKINVPCEELLQKVRYTGVQHKKSAKMRKADIFGAYDVVDEYKSKLDGKVILLIDDVKTTGATLNECAKMLKIYGADAVYAATIAIAKKK
ncbi:MAG: hypothetical protein NC397_03200 [Clostridium sp.]|nr:hypothetical protein [Clostridium sp.]